MVVLPVKWIPYLLVFTGIVCLITGEVDPVAGVVMTAIGGMWLYFKHKGS